MTDPAETATKPNGDKEEKMKEAEGENLDTVYTEGNATSSNPTETDSNIISESELGESSNKEKEGIPSSSINPTEIAEAEKTRDDKQEDETTSLHIKGEETNISRNQKKKGQRQRKKLKKQKKDRFLAYLQKKAKDEPEKAKEGTASSSTNRTESVTYDVEGNTSSLIPKESSSTTQGHHDHAVVMPELGESSNRATNPTKVGADMGVFLFEVYVTPKDIELGRLLIPVEQALDYFPPLANHQEIYDECILITYPCRNQCFRGVQYDIRECAFKIETDLSQWLIDSFDALNMKAMDVIRFYRPVQPSQEYHYLWEIVKRSQQVPSIPEIIWENLLFLVNVTAESIMFSRLVVPKEAVIDHLSILRIPTKTHDKERLYFSDAQNNEWIVQITASGSKVNPIHMLIFEEPFVSAYHLEDGHMITFYEPVHRLNSRHFLIEFHKPGGARTEPRQSSSAENNCSGQDDDSGNDGREAVVRVVARRGGNSVGSIVLHEETKLDQSSNGHATSSSGDLIDGEEDKMAIKGI